MQQELDPNPYRPTLGRVDDPALQLGLDFVPILLRWEKFRLYYNAVLIALTLLLSLFLIPQLLLRPLYWMQLCLGGLIANLCFFTGPAFDAYGHYFLLWNHRMSFALFVVGLLFTCLLATAFVNVIAL